MSDVKKEAVTVIKGVAEAAASSAVDNAAAKVTTKLENDAAKSSSDWVQTRNTVEAVAVTGLAGYLKGLLGKLFGKL
ncbi:hypothetical protein KIAC18_003985 [Sporomusa sphaeroides]|uniref:hypothetical protein n=1 Tax=Sporomusa sphaeroides TaxID=47679 RepID=UPI003DA05C0D